MIRHILVPTDGSESAMLAVRYAADLAKDCGAVLHGLHVVDVKLLEGPFLRDISASLGTAPFVNYQGNIAMILEERGNAALDEFRRICDETGVSCKTSQVTGVVVREIVEQGELTDMIVLGRSGEHSPWLEGLVGSTTQGVVRRAKRPVLVTGVAASERKRLLAAYDGSPFAKHAIQTAAGLSAEWQAMLHVLIVEQPERAEVLKQGALEYLAAHNLDVSCELRIGDPSEMIVEYAGECRADILVMGAYGHTKVRELVVGSTTAYALAHAPCPVLLTR